MAAGAGRPRQRGRGLQLIRALTDDLDLDRSAGTVLTARRTLHRPPVLDAAPAPAPGRAGAVPYGGEVVRGATPVLRLRGAVDMTAEQPLRADLLGAARGGALPLLVDLDEVTLPGSAGVRVLHELAGPLGLRLHASPGTPARAVVDLTGLSDRLAEPAPTPA